MGTKSAHNKTQNSVDDTGARTRYNPKYNTEILICHGTPEVEEDQSTHATVVEQPWTATGLSTKFIRQDIWKQNILQGIKGKAAQPSEVKEGDIVTMVI